MQIQIKTLFIVQMHPVVLCEVDKCKINPWRIHLNTEVVWDAFNHVFWRVLDKNITR